MPLEHSCEASARSRPAYDAAETASPSLPERFARFWRDPSTDRMGELLHDDVVLMQPLSPPLRGLQAAQKEFERIFMLIPDLTAEIDRAVIHDDVAYIKFRLRGHLGSRWVEWPVVDVMRMRDNKVERRDTYFDPLPLVFALLCTPSAWLRWWASKTARPWIYMRARLDVTVPCHTSGSERA